jgi:transcriptional regulator with XRE-family HTH domain
MGTRIRTRLAHDAARANREQLARLGSDVRVARLRRRLTQAQLGGRVGLSQSAISRAERAFGGGLTLDAWQRIALALQVTFRAALQRDHLAETVDAGHLEIQELVLRLGRAAGYRGLVELPTRPAEPWRSIDVALADDVRRRLIVVECWNTVGDLGVAARSSMRKLAEAADLAVGRWGTTDSVVGLLWVLRDTRGNRALAARFPEVFAARFTGSSVGWIRALMLGAAMPMGPGLVWANTASGRLFAWRHSRKRPV